MQWNNYDNVYNLDYDFDLILYDEDEICKIALNFLNIDYDLILMLFDQYVQDEICDIALKCFIQFCNINNI